MRLRYLYNQSTITSSFWAIEMEIYVSCLFQQMKYVADDSTTFWAIGPKSGVLAKHVENTGQEVEMVIPFEDTNFGEVCFIFEVTFLY